MGFCCFVGADRTVARSVADFGRRTFCCHNFFGVGVGVGWVLGVPSEWVRKWRCDDWLLWTRGLSIFYCMYVGPVKRIQWLT